MHAIAKFNFEHDRIMVESNFDQTERDDLTEAIKAVPGIETFDEPSRKYTRFYQFGGLFEDVAVLRGVREAISQWLKKQ